MPHLLIRRFKMHLLRQAHWGTLTSLKSINDFSGIDLVDLERKEADPRETAETRKQWPESFLSELVQQGPEASWDMDVVGHNKALVINEFYP